MVRLASLAVCLVACRPETRSHLVSVDLPVQEDPTVLAMRNRGDVRAMREHMWKRWASITSGAQPWWTWPRSDVAMDRADRGFRSLQPFRNGDVIERETLPVAFDVRFDRISATHIREHQLGRRDRQTPFLEFPAGAIAVKAVWFAVKQRGTTTMPIWDGTPARSDELGNADHTWPRSVTIDASRLADFIHVILGPGDVSSARAATHDDSLMPGDAMVLVGLHVTVKEIREWTWATLWWHDAPGAGPYAADRPSEVTAAARHYLMDVTFSSTTPPEADGSPRACMNPWLEARFPGGVTSNCIACHQRAVVGALGYLPVTRGPLATNELGERVQTDFVWSLALEAR